MRTQSCTWAGVTATVYHFDKGDGLPSHQHPIEHTTQLINGRAEVQINGRPPVELTETMLVLPADTPHEIMALEDGTIFLNVIAGDYTGAAADNGPQQQAGIQLEDGTVA